MNFYNQLVKETENARAELYHVPQLIDGMHGNISRETYIAFGNNEQDEKYLREALKINPDGIDPNYFYADFLIQDDREVEAKSYLEHALEAADRPGRKLADAGRRQEIKAALSKLN